jgi:hypothetical protein
LLKGGELKMLDDKLARVKKLISKREEIDAELSQLLGISEKTKRGRQPKGDIADDRTDTTAVESSSSRAA